jgi:hypothetical protein
MREHRKRNKLCYFEQVVSTPQVLLLDEQELNPLNLVE